MVNQTTLAKYCHQYLQVDKFTDYCPNGLQIQGKSDIKKILDEHQVASDRRIS
jgi:putative NIF3 family GTP cyclohydrolase 1 type 2